MHMRKRSIQTVAADVSELEEVTALADRLLVFHQGRIAGEVDPAVASAEEIGLLMTGGRRAA